MSPISIVLFSLGVTLSVILFGWIMSEVLIPIYPTLSVEFLQHQVERKEKITRGQITLGVIAVFLLILAVIFL